jgi:hypothetical protein
MYLSIPENRPHFKRTLGRNALNRDVTEGF